MEKAETSAGGGQSRHSTSENDRSNSTGLCRRRGIRSSRVGVDGHSSPDAEHGEESVCALGQLLHVPRMRVGAGGTRVARGQLRYRPHLRRTRPEGAGQRRYPTILLAWFGTPESERGSRTMPSESAQGCQGRRSRTSRWQLIGPLVSIDPYSPPPTTSLLRLSGSKAKGPRRFELLCAGTAGASAARWTVNRWALGRHR
jgi:hypothetical protein